MKKLIHGLAMIIILCLISLTFAGQETAEFVLLNGKVFTVSDQNPWVQALAVKSSKIIAIGSDEEIKKWDGPQKTSSMKSLPTILSLYGEEEDTPYGSIAWL